MIRLPGRRLRSLDGPRVIAVGLTFFMVCGVLTVLLAARWLPSAEYTTFAAFSGLLGMLVLGPASSLEQESALRASGGDDGLRRSMALRCVALCLLVAVLLVVPLDHWQERLLGEVATVAVISTLLGAPLLLGLAVGRGVATARGHFRSVGAAHAAAGLGTVLMPPLLYGLGVPLLTAFVVGAVVAWVPALVVVRPWHRSRPAAPPSPSPLPTGCGPGGWIVVANLLLLGNLLAVPPLLRWHVQDVGADMIANLQLLSSLSRLSTTAVLGFLPLLMSRLAGHPWSATPTTSIGAVRLSIALGAATVLCAAVLGNPLIAALTGRDAGVPLTTNLLTTAPAVLLCPAIVLMGVATARRRYALTTAAWTSGLVVLAATAAVEPGSDVRVVLLGLLVAAALPTIVLATGLAGSWWASTDPDRRGRSGASDRDARRPSYRTLRTASVRIRVSVRGHGRSTLG